MNFKKSFLCLTTAAVMASAVFVGACKKDDGGDLPITSGGKPEVVQPTRTVETTKLTVYDAPNLLTSSEKLTASVNDTPLFVYDTRVNHRRSFTFTYSQDKGQVVAFDFEGKVHMKVEINGTTELSDVTVRPLSYEVETTVTGNVVEFDLEYSANYTLEYNTDKDGADHDAADNALHIFANPIEENPITAEEAANDDNIMYIGPGVYSAGAIPLHTGKTLYLAGGAYVYGKIRAEDLQNITIRGRGIIAGEIYDRTVESQFTLPIELRKCKNVKIEGISILDPAGWAITLYQCENVTIDNIHIITARGNGDGISVQSCKDVLVKGGFVRTWDDSLVVKNTDRGNTSNVTFDGVTVWTDLAQSCEVGFETNGALMDKITFKNITIIHNYHKAAMSIHNCDDAKITNVTYQSITIEDAQMLGDNRFDGLNDFLIDINIAHDLNWSKANERGPVSRILFENIKVLSMADTIVSRINGESTGASVRNVLITGVEIEGNKITSASDLKLACNKNTSDIKVGGCDYDVFGAGVELPYILDLKNDNVAKTVVPGAVQNGLEVPQFAILDVKETFMGSPRDITDAEISVSHGKGTGISAAYDDGTDMDANNTLQNAFDGDRSTAYVASDWTGVNNEFIALTIDFKQVIEPGVIRIYLAKDSGYVYDFSVAIYTKPTTTSEKFTRLQTALTYSSSPADGNYFDIKLTGIECAQLQFRFFRVDGMTGQRNFTINEISFYPNSLSTGASVIDSTEHYDIYKASNLVDGDESTYWESDRIWNKDPNAAAQFTIDLDGTYNITNIVMHLVPNLTWPARTQKIEILVSTDNTNWTTAIEKTDYVFDSVTGNSVSLELAPTSARYVKFVIYSNSSGYGAQLSEIYIYGV